MRWQSTFRYFSFSVLCLCTFPNWGAEVLKESGFSTSFRYRYHFVEDDLRGDARASTALLRASVIVPQNEWLTWEATIAHVHAFNEGHYNSVTVTTDTSPIPDPPGTELNRLLLTIDSGAGWKATIGRQPLSFDNERHVGSIDFWQKNQSFDALRISYNDLLKIRFDYVYVESVQRIFGSDANHILSQQDIRYAINPIRPNGELGVHQHNSHLVNFRYKANQTTNISAYLIRLDNQSWNVFSSLTVGARLETSLKPENYKYRLVLEAASQNDTGENPLAYNAFYTFIEGEIQFRSHRFSLSNEYLGQDNGVPFATSLGTNHKFQGWADVFTDYLANSGMVNSYFTYQGRQGKLRWRSVYHHFYDYEQEQTIGNELDLEIAFRFTRKWEAKVVFAKYFADNGVLQNPASEEDLTAIFASVAYNL
tara:strand:- start:2262 stop:3530 length:1269 start_codon:yes stop_codon:yes gene_type:complete